MTFILGKYMCVAHYITFLCINYVPLYTFIYIDVYAQIFIQFCFTYYKLLIIDIVLTVFIFHGIHS